MINKNAIKNIFVFTRNLPLTNYHLETKSGIFLHKIIFYSTFVEMNFNPEIVTAQIHADCGASFATRARF